MPILTRPAFGPATALAYVTIGSLIDVWTGVWYFTRDHQLTHSEQFWVIGLFLTGLTFILWGLFLGPLGRAARHAELPPQSVTPAEASIQQTAAANPPAVEMPAAMPNQQPMARTVQAAPAAPVMAPAAAPAPPAGTVMPQPRVS